MFGQRNFNSINFDKKYLLLIKQEQTKIQKDKNLFE